MTGYVLRRLEPHAEHIIARYVAGETYGDIAADHDCGWGTIRRLLLSHEIQLRRPEERPRRSNIGTVRMRQRAA